MSDPTLKMRLDGFRSCIYDAARRFDIEPDLLRGVVAPIFQALRVPRGAAPATRGAAPPDLVTCEGQPVPHLRSGLCAAPREWRRGDETAPAGPAPVTAPRDDRRCGHGVYQPGCGDCARQLSQRASAPSSPPPSGGALHASDCATHNEPAYPAGPCDCKPRRPRSGDCCCDPPESPTQTDGECNCCGAASGAPCGHAPSAPAPRSESAPPPAPALSETPAEADSTCRACDGSGQSGLMSACSFCGGLGRAPAAPSGAGDAGCAGEDHDATQIHDCPTKETR
jgi:hypothetical protein